MAEGRTIRVGILCKGTTLPRWQAQAVRHLVQVPGVELVAVGVPRADHAVWSVPAGPRAYLEKRCLNLLIKTTAAPEDVSDPLALIPSIHLPHESGRFGERALWKAFAPDLLISFLPENGGAPPEASAQPIHSFTFGGRPIAANGLPGMRHRFLSDRSLRVSLSGLGSGAASSHFPLRNEEERPTLDQVLAGAAWLPAKLAVALQKMNGTVLDQDLIEEIGSADDQASMIELIKVWVDLELKRLRDADQQRPARGEWNIGTLYQPIASLLDEEASTNVRWLPSPSGGNHRMEPFGYIAPDGQLNVLYRKKRTTDPIDVIARLRPKSDSVLKRSRSMLSTSASLHYPFVVERPEGAFAVISYPHQDRTELFKVAETNDRLEHIRILLNKALSSPTLFNFEEQWWLLGTDPEAPDPVLLAYHSPDFEGPYRPHPMNPVKIALTGTRPAGTPFVHEGVLWRPTLDLSDPSTVTVLLNRVDTLTTTSFSETTGRRLTGFRGTVYSNGIRTVSAMGEVTLIDGLRSATAERQTTKSKGSHKTRKEHRS